MASVTNLKDTAAFRRWGGLDIMPSSEPTPEITENKCNASFPFCQIVNPNPSASGGGAPAFVTSSTGWVIHVYGVDALCVSAPHNNGSISRNLVNESIKVAHEIAQLLVKNGWTSVEFIAATNTLSIALAIECKRHGIETKNYTPDAEDERRYAALKQLMGSKWEERIEMPKAEEPTNVGGASGG